MKIKNVPLALLVTILSFVLSGCGVLNWGRSAMPVQSCEIGAWTVAEPCPDRPGKKKDRAIRYGDRTNQAFVDTYIPERSSSERPLVGY